MSSIINNGGGGGGAGGFTRLTGPLTLYVRTVPVPVTLSNGSPCVANWPSHGLQVNDPVVFSSPYDLGGTVELGNPACTISIASPGVVSLSGHPYANGDPVSFDTSGALPGGLAINTIYFVVNAVPGVSFQVATTAGGTPINTSGTQSGNQYVWRNNTIPSGVIDGAIYFVLSVIDANNFTFSKTAGGAAINTTTTQVGRIVASTGNDANNGLTQTRTGAFMTVGHAWRQICGFYNLNAQIVTVQCAHGTYFGGSFSDNVSGDVDASPVFCSDTLTAAVAAFWLGAGEVLFLGDALNPDAVVWRANTRGRGAIDTNCDFDGNQTFKGFRLEFSGATNFGVDYFQTLGFNTVTLDTMVFGTVYPPAGFGSGTRMDVRQGTCQLVNPCRVLANGSSNGELIVAEGNGQWFKNDNTGGPIIGINTPPFGDIFHAVDNGYIKSQLTVWQGLWSYFDIGFVDGQGYIANHNGPPGNNPTNTTPSQFPNEVNDRGFYFEFQAPNQQTVAMFGAPGCPVDLFYLWIQPVAGFNQQLNNSHGHVLIDPAGVLATGTITMSPFPWYGQIVNIRTTQTITAITFAPGPGSGQAFKGAPSTLAAGQKVEAFWEGNTNTWMFSN